MANVFVYDSITIAAGTQLIDGHQMFISFLSEKDNTIQCSKQTNTAQSTNESAAIINMAISQNSV